MNNKIVTTVMQTKGQQAIGCITLNKPKALNALDLDMVQAMQYQLDEWREDNNIGGVFIDSQGDRAFCAGGDIVSMYKAMEQQHAPHILPDFMAQFFEQEYRLDYAIHAYPKPIICWGNGIIMGGGLGVFAGASHKIVTQSARVAMPEITIGLFPDVGASYFLNQMPAGVGKFLGLSAASINAKDCVDIGLADTFLVHEAKALLLTEFASLTHVNRQSVTTTIVDLHQTHPATQEQWQALDGNLSSILADLKPLDSIDKTDDVDTFLASLNVKFPELKIVQNAISSYRHGSPITAQLVLQQLQRAKDLTLAQCFEMELSMAYQCSVVGEFQEGVRALLIDKDNAPNWLFKSTSEVPKAFVDAHFERFSASDNAIQNPLSTLVAEYGEAHE